MVNRTAPTGRTLPELAAREPDRDPGGPHEAPGKVIVQAVAHDDTACCVPCEIHALTDVQLLGETLIRDAAGVC